jgi:hypothetical protein
MGNPLCQLHLIQLLVRCEEKLFKELDENQEHAIHDEGSAVIAAQKFKRDPITHVKMISVSRTQMSLYDLIMTVWLLFSSLLPP